jgi:FAD/FMN-containing dehydrogenase
MQMSNSSTFLDAARTILGERGLTNDPALVDPWLTDWRGRYRGAALALASPASTEEVAALVDLAREHCVPIVPQGGNSGMCGGATPDRSGDALLLSLRRMDAVRAFDPAQRRITCDAGLVLQTLHERVADEGLRFPLTLGGKGSATIGGLIATNAGGTQVLRHGTMRASVLGLEVVTPQGEVFSDLDPLKKDNRGFDLKQLFIGSEGTLGIVTGATLALVPAVAERIVAWAGLGSLDDARTLLLECRDRFATELEGFEVLPEHCLAAVVDHLPEARRPLGDPQPWNALVELALEEKDAAAEAREALETLLAGALERGLIADAVLAANESQADAFWQLRDTIAPAEKALGPAVQHDISVPEAQMPAFLAAISPEIEQAHPGTKAIGFGHLGDGNIHFHVLAPRGAPPDWIEHDGREISAKVYERVTEWGGSISAEHGIGQAKRDVLARLADPARLDLLRRVKAALDPDQLLNPGKLVTPAP